MIEFEVKSTEQIEEEERKKEIKNKLIKKAIYSFCFGISAVWAMIERKYGIPVTDQLIMAGISFFMVLIS